MINRVHTNSKWFPRLVEITITNNYSTLFPWMAAIAFKPFSVKVKNLRIAPAVISLLKIRLKLRIILHDLGNEWRMLHFLIRKKEKNMIWIDISWIMEKIIGKLNKCNHWALDPKSTLNNISLTTEHSHDIPNNLLLFVFTSWQLKILRNLKKM